MAISGMALCMGPGTTGSAPRTSLSRRWSYGSSGLLVATTAVAEEKDFLQVFPVRPLDLVDGRRGQLLWGISSNETWAARSCSSSSFGLLEFLAD